MVKLTDGRLVDHAFRQRLEVAAAAAAIDDFVVGPISTGGTSSHGSMIGWSWSTRWCRGHHQPFVSNTTCGAWRRRWPAAPRTRRSRSLRRAHCCRTGRLHRFHRVRADSNCCTATIRPANVMFSRSRGEVFDFDDCGYGPVEFEVGNTLYMMLFDAAMASNMRTMNAFVTGSFRSTDRRLASTCPTNSSTSRSDFESRRSVDGWSVRKRRRSGSAPRRPLGAKLFVRSSDPKPAIDARGRTVAIGSRQLMRFTHSAAMAQTLQDGSGHDQHDPSRVAMRALAGVSCLSAAVYECAVKWHADAKVEDRPAGQQRQRRSRGDRHDGPVSHCGDDAGDCRGEHPQDPGHTHALVAEAMHVSRDCGQRGVVDTGEGWPFDERAGSAGPRAVHNSGAHDREKCGEMREVHHASCSGAPPKGGDPPICWYRRDVHAPTRLHLAVPRTPHPDVGRIRRTA